MIFTWTLAAAGQSPATPQITPAEARDHVGRAATVCGRIVTVTCTPEDPRARLSMDEPYWDGVDVVIQTADRPALGPRLGHFLFQRVCATGPVEKHDRGFFVFSTPAQLVLQQPGLDVSPRFGEAYTTCDEGVKFPEVVREVKPHYTPEAMRALKEGKVLLHAVVLPNGRVGDVVITVSLDKDYGLDAQAVHALKGWRFKPATRLGQPVPVVVSVEMTFTLRAP